MCVGVCLRRAGYEHTYTFHNRYEFERKTTFIHYSKCNGINREEVRLMNNEMACDERERERGMYITV